MGCSDLLAGPHEQGIGVIGTIGTGPDAPYGPYALWTTIAAGTRLPIPAPTSRFRETGPSPPRLPTLPNYSVIPCAS
jgi:hypothetical protein